MTRNQEPETRNCCSAAPVRTWRPMMLWSGGIVLALGLIWLVGVVVVPYWQARALVHDYSVRSFDRLGPPRDAVRKMRIYLKISRLLPGEEKSRQETCDAVSMFGGESIPVLVEALSDSDQTVRRRAASVLGECCPDWLSRDAATSENRRDAKQAVSALEKALSDQEPSVCISAALALCRVDPAKTNLTVRFLIGRLQESDEESRLLAAHALSLIGPEAKEAIPMLEAVLKDEHETVRIVAARALKSVRGEEPPK